MLSSTCCCLYLEDKVENMQNSKSIFIIAPLLQFSFWIKKMEDEKCVEKQSDEEP